MLSLVLLPRNASACRFCCSADRKLPGDPAVYVPSLGPPPGDFHPQWRDTRAMAREQNPQPLTVTTGVETDEDRVARRDQLSGPLDGGLAASRPPSEEEPTVKSMRSPGPAIPFAHYRHPYADVQVGFSGAFVLRRSLGVGDTISAMRPRFHGRTECTASLIERHS